MRKIIRILVFSFSILVFSFLNCNSFINVSAIEKFENEVEEAASEYINLPIFMYHFIFHKNTGMYTISKEQLEKDLIYLKENGYEGITFSDLIAYQEKGAELPQKPVMLTFDDGSITNYLYAFPLLKKYNMKAVFAVVGSYTDACYDENGKEKKFPHVNYRQIKKMSESGLVEIQNHTYDLHKRTNKRNSLRRNKEESLDDYDEAISHDLMQTHVNLKNKSGVICTAVVYPFGVYSKDIVPILKKLGYKASLTCTAGMNKISKTSSLFNLKRWNRPSGISSREYFYEKI